MTPMPHLPAEVQVYKRTPIFTQDSIPAGLLRRHNTKPGAWARLVLISGRLKYRVLEPVLAEWMLTPEQPAIIEPTVLHEIEPAGECSFYLEFLKLPEIDEAGLHRELDQALGAKPISPEDD